MGILSRFIADNSDIFASVFIFIVCSLVLFTAIDKSVESYRLLKRTDQLKKELNTLLNEATKEKK